MVPILVLQRHPDDSWTLAEPMQVSPRTNRVLTSLADAVIPSEPRTESTIDDVVRHALVCLQYMPRASARTFILGMRVLNWCPLWLLRGLRPLTSLSSDQGRAHLRAATHSRWLPVRMLMYGPLGLFMFTYFDQDYVHRAIDYDPIPFVQSRIELRQRWIEGEQPESEEIHHLPVIPK